MLPVVHDTEASAEDDAAGGSLLDRIVRDGAPQMLAAALQAALAEIWQAEDKAHAATAAKQFVEQYGGKWPKAAAKITDDLDVLLAFYDYPLEHWVHLRTTNPIESTFATVALVRAGATFYKGKLLERVEAEGRISTEEAA